VNSDLKQLLASATKLADERRVNLEITYHRWNNYHLWSVTFIGEGFEIEAATPQGALVQLIAQVKNAG
jgi:hypothetical protein